MRKIYLFVCITIAISSYSYASNVALCYHNFDYSLNHFYAVLPEVFEWQVQYLKQHGVKILHADELAEMYSSKDKVIEDSALLTMDDGDKNINKIIPVIRKENAPVTLYIYPSVINRKKAYLSYEDINNLKQLDVVDFGCHAYTHPILTRSTDDELYRELVKSKNRISQLTGRKIETFAYPYGSFNEKVKLLVSQNYKIAFGVVGGSNTSTTDRYNLRRTIMYKSTTFSEFIQIVENGIGRQLKKGYSVRDLREEKDGEYFKYGRVKLYKFPEEEKDYTVLIVPGADVGTGWMSKVIDRISKSGGQSYVVAGRNNDIPFDKFKEGMYITGSWGLNEFAGDVKNAIDVISEKNRKFVIVTWGSGFDITMAILAGNLSYREKVKGIITINPSIRIPGNTKDDFRNNIRLYDSLLRKGRYSTRDFSSYLKIKTISDLVVLRPDEPSPFAEELGYKNITNKQLFFEIMGKEDHPGFSVDYSGNDYTLNDFKEAFIKPLPLLPMCVPIKLLSDLNTLWYNDFNLKKTGIIYGKEISYPVVYVFSSEYKENIPRIEKTFPGLKTTGQYLMGDNSTVGIMLSNKASDILMEELKKM